MTFRRTLLLGALASCSLLVAGATARADYTFSTTGGTAPAGVAFGSASTLILTGQPTSPNQFGQNLINIQDISILTANPGNTTDTGNINFSFTLNLSQTVGHGATSGGSTSTVFNGTINITRSDVGGEVSTLNPNFTNAPPLVIGNTTYTFSFPAQYAAPNVNSQPTQPGSGNISILITPSSVPEPASVAMLGTGLLSVLGLAVRRVKKA